MNESSSNSSRDEAVSWLNRPAVWPWLAVAFVTLVIFFAIRLYGARPVPGQVELERWAGQSFRDVLYYPALSLTQGVNPYNSTVDDADDYMNLYPVADHFPLYTPLVLALGVPLSWLQVNVSLAVYFALTIACLLALSRVTLKLAGGPVGWGTMFAVAGMTLMTDPGRSAVNSGQLAIPLSLATLLMMCWGGRSDALAGVSGMVALAKPTFGGPMALIMLIGTQHWRAVLLALLWGGLSVLVGGAVVFSLTDGLNFQAVGDVVRGNLNHFHDDPVVLTSNNFARIEIVAAVEYVLRQETPSWLSPLIAIVVVVVTGTAMRWGRSGMSTTDMSNWVASPMGALAIVAFYICYYHNVYDLVLLAMPLTALLCWRWNGFRNIRPVQRYVLLGLLSVPCWNVFHKDRVRELLVSFGENSPFAVSLAETTQRVAAIANSASLLAVWLILIAVVSLPQSGECGDYCKRIVH